MADSFWFRVDCSDARLPPHITLLKTGSTVHLKGVTTCAVEIRVRRNLMIWDAAIHCTLVVRNIMMVSLH